MIRTILLNMTGAAHPVLLWIFFLQQDLARMWIAAGASDLMATHAHRLRAAIVATRAGGALDG
jgi:hypothetical protein